MLAKVSERQMHWVRMALTAGWLLLTASLFYDPISPFLTDPEATTWSPLRIDPSVCVSVQGKCLEETPYAIGAPVFWGMIVPASIFILLVLGHEFWRRICPLSFLSQIPRALGKERKHKRVDKKTGKTRYEIAKVPQDSWLAKNHLYLQLGLFFLGINNRILFVNSERIVLGLFFLAVMLTAIVVGYIYGGKSWCHYFCPMAPVQKIYTEPRALLNSTAHVGERQAVTQSMCRTVKEGRELSACVACNSPCLDIDAERHYWENLKDPQRQFLHYAYVGFAVGYFLYYALYSGGFEYYFSGAWAHEANAISRFASPGFFLFGQAIPIPKFIAAPLTIAVFGGIFYMLGRWLENWYYGYLVRHHRDASRELARHRIFAIFTFFVFNFFYIFAGRNFVRLLPTPLRFFVPLALMACSALWLQRTWGRQAEIYLREGLAARLRKQLKKLNLQLDRVLEGRVLDDLSADEVYVLAKALPDFSSEQRLQAYKGILRDALDEGVVSGADTKERFARLRQELGVSDGEHDTVLESLGQEAPELFDPSKEHSRERLLRLESYRSALIEKLIGSWEGHPNREQVAALLTTIGSRDSGEIHATLDNILNTLTPDDRIALTAMRQEYGITAEDEADAMLLAVPEDLWSDFADRLDLLGAIDPGEHESLRSIFTKLDEDRSGDITLAELRLFLQSLGVEASDAQVEEMLKWADTNADRRITYGEFCELLRNLKSGRYQLWAAIATETGIIERLDPLEEDKLRDLFQACDRDCSGKIDLSELGEYVRNNLAANYSDEDIRAALHLADTSGDRAIDYPEFREVFLGLKTEHHALWATLADRLGVSDSLGPTESERLLQLFRALDRDGSDDICFDELKQYILNVLPSGNEQVVEEMMVWADASGDRRISYGEFCEVFKYLQDKREVTDSAPTRIRLPEPEVPTSTADSDNQPTVLYNRDDAPTLLKRPEE